MKGAVLAIVFAALAASCGNYGNVYLPEGRRKPDLGPEPSDFGPSAALNRTAAAFRFRLNAPPGVPLQLRVECTGPSTATLAVWVNARRLAAGTCPYQASIPDGTIVPKTAAVVEIEASDVMTVREAGVSPRQP